MARLQLGAVPLYTPVLAVLVFAYRHFSPWTVVLFFAPAFVTGLYGMNFDVMPELHWPYGYPMAIGLMIAAGLLMYVISKRKNWL